MRRSAAASWLWLSLAITVFLTGCGGGSSAPPAHPSFTLSATPSSAVVGQGGAVTATVTVIPQHGFTGSVALAVSGLPSGVSASFNPQNTSGTSVLTLSTDSSASLATTSITVTGTSSGLAPTAALQLTVTAPSVTVTLSPVRAAVTITQPQQFTPTVVGNMGSSNVDWSVDGVAGGNASVGTITVTGLYAPPSVPGAHTVAATSVVLPSSSASATIAITDLAGVFTYHNDLARDGANTQEYALSPSNVTTTTFGKLFSCDVDGAVYTQPLWVPGVSISGARHNVVFVATEHDSLYAFDADANPCVTYWHVMLIDTNHGGSANETPIIWNDVGNCFGDIYPEVGVTGTPVIDPATNTIYVVSSSEAGTNGSNCSYNSGTYFRRLHALDLATGNEKYNGPASITASVPGVGDGGSTVTFDPQKHHQRSGLALANGTVYIAWAAHEDATPYHGWLFGYDASDLTQAPSVFNTTPNGGLGGIWASGGAPAIDAIGDIYITTGNGIFDASSTTVPFNDYGDSILRLHPFSGYTSNGVNLNLEGWFTPWDQDAISNADADVGSGAVILLPDQTTDPTHLLAQIGKGQPSPVNQAIVYLIDRDNMGQFNPVNDGQVVQRFPATCCGLWGTPAFWNNGLYFAGAWDALKVFAFDPSKGLFNTTPSSQSAHIFAYPTATPSISSQGASNGIAWAIDASLYGYAAGQACYTIPVPASCTGPAVLYAYDATNLATEVWNSAQAPNDRDRSGDAVKFVPPTVANGRVYVSTRTEVDVYGLLPK